MGSGVFKTYEEGALSRERALSGLRVVTLCGCFAFVWMAIAIGMPLTMFLEALGATGLQIGLVVAAQQIPLVLQVPSALIAERLPSRKPMWFALAVSHRLLWLVPASLPFVLDGGQASVWTLIAVVAVSSVLAQMSTPIWLGWMADLVPQDISARFWGTRQAAMTFTFVLAVWLSGWALDFFKAHGCFFAGFGILFGVAALFGVLDICIHLRVPEPIARPHPPEMGLARKFADVLSQRDFLFLSLSMVAWYFGMALIGAFMPVCMKRDFGMNYTEISLLIMAASTGAFLMSIPLGRLGDRFGARTICFLCMAFAPLLLCAWFFVNGSSHSFELPLLGRVGVSNVMLVMLLPQLVSGGLYAAVGLYQFHLAGLLSKREGRTLSMAVHWSLIGAVSCLSPLAGGWLMDYFARNPIGMALPAGGQMNFFHVLLILHVAIAWVAAFVILKISVKGGDLTVSDVFRLLRTGNPFRAVKGAYSLPYVPSSRDSAKGKDAE